MEVLNERFGLELGEADQLLFDQFEESWAADPDLVNQARNNTLENFRLVFNPKFINTSGSRSRRNTHEAEGVACVVAYRSGGRFDVSSGC